MKYEVLQNTVCDGWVNIWHEYDDDNEEIPMVFDTKKEAEVELKEFLYDMLKAYNMGDLSEPYTREEFKIVKVSK